MQIWPKSQLVIGMFGLDFVDRAILEFFRENDNEGKGKYEYELELRVETLGAERDKNFELGGGGHEGKIKG
jgi:hypothetical protein